MSAGVPVHIVRCQQREPTQKHGSIAQGIKQILNRYIYIHIYTHTYIYIIFLIIIIIINISLHLQPSILATQVWLFDKLKHKRAPMLARLMELLVAFLFLTVMLAATQLHPMALSASDWCCATNLLLQDGRI